MRFGRRPRFESNEELFAALRHLIAELERTGYRAEAAELHSGFRCLNGLTDGWALLLESLDKIQEPLSGDGSALAKDVADMRDVVSSIVRR